MFVALWYLEELKECTGFESTGDVRPLNFPPIPANKLLYTHNLGQGKRRTQWGEIAAERMVKLREHAGSSPVLLFGPHVDRYHERANARELVYLFWLTYT